MFRISLVNLARVIFEATPIITASTEDGNYPATNAASPDRPFQPWKSGTAGDEWLVVDFGAPAVLNAVALIRANFASATIQGNATDVWTSPAYSQTVTIARNPISGRYHHVHQIVGSFEYRYLRILIPSQATLDGAVAYVLGGVWAAQWTYPPRALRWGYTLERMEPAEDLRTLSQAMHRLRLGPPIAHAIAQRQAILGASTPGLDDELAAWSEFDRQMAEADAVLVWWAPADPAQVWVMRRLTAPTWTIVNPRIADAAFELEEVIAGGGVTVGEALFPL
jgi:hypothetical protein